MSNVTSKLLAHASNRWSLALAAGLLASCGGSDDRARVDRIEAGPTPFISTLTLAVDDAENVTSARFRIAPKPGAASKAVDVTYRAEALARRQLIDEDTDRVKLPVFGLHAGTANIVTVELAFNDGGAETLLVKVDTPAFVDPTSIYDRPNILTRRQAGTDLGIDFFAIKSRELGPVVLDSDGDIRWVGSSTPLAAQWTAFHDGGFVVGSPMAPMFTRLELDGSSTEVAVQSPAFTNFHHNIDPGKTGLLGEFDAVVGGVTQVESIVAEFASDGSVIRQWDLGQIIGDYMRSQGDDPSNFVRPGVDWFHMNSAMYDPTDDTVIVSSRENFVVKLDYSAGEIVWILGDPSFHWYSFASLRAKALTLEPGGLYPIGQHALSLTADGHLMLFNNGFPSQNQPAGAPSGNTRAYSAVSAYRIDPAAGTAQEAWRFDYGQSIGSAVCSSVYETPQRSLLVNFAKAENGTKVRLVGLDGQRQVAFDFEYPNTTGCDVAWNAVPVPFEGMTIR